MDSGDVLVAMFRESESQALFFLKEEGLTRYDLLNYISHGIKKEEDGGAPRHGEERTGAGQPGRPRTTRRPGRPSARSRPTAPSSTSRRRRATSTR